jgi:hypothetical protein
MADHPIEIRNATVTNNPDGTVNIVGTEVKPQASQLPEGGSPGHPDSPSGGSPSHPTAPPPAPGGHRK